MRQLVCTLADGRLELAVNGVKRGLWVETGQVCAVASDAEEEKLGRWLVVRGVLGEDEMALSLLRQPDNVPFGRQLVEEGRISADLLLEELRLRAVHLLSRLLFAHGAFAFHAGERLAADVPALPSTTASLLADSVRLISDRASFERLVPPACYLRAADEPLLLHQKLNLTPAEAYLLSRIDGTTTPVVLRRLVPASAAEVARGLAVLVATGLVEVGDTAVASAPAEIDPPVAVEIEEPLQFSGEQRREYEEVIRLAADISRRDHYSRLGLAPGALQDQIHNRYRELTRVYHPDRAREAHLHTVRRELAEITARIHEAYEVLGNPMRRAQYEEEGRGGARAATEGESVAARQERERARRALVEANVQRARELIRAGDFGAAAPLLEQAVRFDPTPQHLLMLAHVELRNPMWVQRALDHLRMTVAIEPRCTEAWLELAGFWGSRGLVPRQRQCLEKVLEIDPGNRDVRSTLELLGKRRRIGR